MGSQARSSILAVLVCLGIVLSVSAASARDTSRYGGRSCVEPGFSFRGVQYLPNGRRWPPGTPPLLHIRASVGAATFLVYRCTDVVVCEPNGHCQAPPQPPPLEMTIDLFRIKGIRTSVAVAWKEGTRLTSDGRTVASYQIAVNGGLRCPPGRSGNPGLDQIRCLRWLSR